MLPRWFKEYLSFHKKERRGLIFLVILLLGLVALNTYQRYFWRSSWQPLQVEYGEQIVQFVESKKKDTVSYKEKPWIPKAIEYFNFDPNTLDSAGWVKLGFSPKQSAAIISYRNAGAQFRKSDDLKKLFVVDEQKYLELEPFITIKTVFTDNKKTESFTKPKWEKKKFEPVTVELNSADTSSLKKLRGIGPSFAMRIVKYRELLGGYVTKQQLLEVYGMDTSRYNPIADNLEIDTLVRTRININSADFKTLVRHPYLHKNQVRAIINYRKQYGDFRSISELRNIHLISPEDLEKLNSYLSVE